MSEREFSVFEPKSDTIIDIRDQYPELWEIAGIDELTDRDVRFAWFYCCKSSPYHKYSERERMKLSLAAAFEKNHRQRRDYSMSIPEKLKPTLDFFASVNPSARIRAKLLAEIAFINIEKAVHGFDSETDDPSIFASTMKNNLDIIPKLIAIMEDGGLGVTEKKPKNRGQNESSPDHVIRIDNV